MTRVPRVYSIDGPPVPGQASPDTPPGTAAAQRRFTSPFIDEAAARKVRSRFFKDYTHFIRGLRVEYLGHVPTDDVASRERVNYCVEKLLDKCNMIESQTADVFLELDARACTLAMHYVDECARITCTRMFALTRISFCSGGVGGGDSKLFAWVYRQETADGFQLECHAVRCTNERRMKIIARKLYAAFNQLGSQPQVAGKAAGPLASTPTGHTAAYNQPLAQRY